MNNDNREKFGVLRILSFNKDERRFINTACRRTGMRKAVYFHNAVMDYSRRKMQEAERYDV